MTKLLVAMAVLVAACGTDSVSLEDYPQELRDSFCRNFVKCGMAKDLDTCRKLNFGIDPYLTASGRAAFEMNKSEFNGGKAQACVDAIANSSCDVTGDLQRALLGGPLPEACDQVVAGALHNGEACGLDSECRSLQCNVPRCNMACCTGTCAGDTAPVRAKAGESCLEVNCVADAYCDFGTDLCAPLKPLNATCTSIFECQLDLVCLRSGLAGTCVKLPKLGEACQNFCQDIGATCSPTSKTCVKVGLAGDACTTADDCSLLYGCDGTAHCSGGLALGAACAFDDHCIDPRAFCDVAAGANTGTCILPKADGMSCNDDSQCNSFFCSADTLQCAPEPVCI
jgi:hypothetical protein